MGSAHAVYSKPLQGAERRRFERFELVAEIELQLRGDLVLLPIVNISAGGVLVRVKQGDLPGVGIDEQVSVFLDVPDMPEPISLTIDATVVRMIPGEQMQIALMWTTAHPQAVAQLAKLLGYVQKRQPT